MKARTNLPAKRDVVAVHKLLEFLTAPLPVDLAEEALRHARRLHDPEALQHRRLVRHQLPQEELALRDVAHPHAPPDLGHLAHHFAEGGSRRLGRETVKYTGARSEQRALCLVRASR